MATAVKPLLWYCEDPKIGMALNYTITPYTSATSYAQVNVEFPGPNAKLGDVCQGNNNSKWVFVKASTTITAGNVIWISPQFTANVMASSSFIISSFGSTYPLSNINVGFAQFNNGTPNSIMLSTTQVVAQPNDYFWACLEADAGLQVNVGATSCQRGAVQVYHSNVTKGSIVTTADNSASVSVTELINLYVNTSLDPTTSSVSQTATDCFTVTRVRTSVSTTV